MAWLIWLIAAVVLMVAELFSLEFVLIMFSIGAFAAAGSAALGASLLVQSVVFAVVSVLALVGIRPAARRALQKHADKSATGIDALAGRIAVVTKRVDEFSGLVKLSGEDWSARAADAESVFQPGEKVVVVEIKGATALVRRQEL